jgi:hypothetical protein
VFTPKKHIEEELVLCELAREEYFPFDQGARLIVRGGSPVIKFQISSLAFILGKLI